MARFRFSPGDSRWTMQAFAAGMLSFLGHSPTFAVRDFTGVVSLGNSPAETSVEITVQANSLELLDKVKASDRKDIEDRMRREVLETGVYPEIRYQGAALSADPIAQGRYRLPIGGQLSLRGITQPYPVDAELTVFSDGLRLRGESTLRLSDFEIRPVTALAGTLKLKDELKLSFDLAALPEEA